MILYLKCMLVVAATAGLPPRILPVVQSIEGGASGIVLQDSNGTQDLGVMQINTIWIPALARRAGLSEISTRHLLINDPCFNIAAAALILRADLAQEHGNLLSAVGDYHSRTPALNQRYAARAVLTARELFSDEKP
jgi:hypothetical protein